MASALYTVEEDGRQDLPSFLRIRPTHHRNRCDVAGQSHLSWVRHERDVVRHWVEVKDVYVNDLLDGLGVRGTHACQVAAIFAGAAKLSSEVVPCRQTARWSCNCVACLSALCNGATEGRAGALWEAGQEGVD